MDSDNFLDRLYKATTVEAIESDDYEAADALGVLTTSTTLSTSQEPPFAVAKEERNSIRPATTWTALLHSIAPAESDPKEARDMILEALPRLQTSALYTNDKALASAFLEAYPNHPGWHTKRLQVCLSKYRQKMQIPLRSITASSKGKATKPKPPKTGRTVARGDGARAHHKVPAERVLSATFYALAHRGDGITYIKLFEQGSINVDYETWRRRLKEWADPSCASTPPNGYTKEEAAGWRRVLFGKSQSV